MRQRDFVDWIESTIHLPLGLGAEPGRIKLPVYLREIAAAMNHASVEKITLAHRYAHVGHFGGAAASREAR